MMARALVFSLFLSVAGLAAASPAMAQNCTRKGTDVTCDDGRRGIFTGDAIIWPDGTRANLASPQARGTYFGVAALSLAVGGGLGNYLGGTFVDLGRSLDAPALPWALFFLIGGGTALALWLNRDTLSAVRSGTCLVASSAWSVPTSVALRAKNPSGSFARWMEGTTVSQTARNVARCRSVSSGTDAPST